MNIWLKNKRVDPWDECYQYYYIEMDINRNFASFFHFEYKFNERELLWKTWQFLVVDQWSYVNVTQQ